jgi:hypothetical protein|tara:strand:+ start:161 stop:508 length:348 start_codon:yes stop_codon:yes gene_type:complete
MAVDFESKESRSDYLNHKLDNLLSGINSTYGQALHEELVTRLERTLKDFNEEFEGIVGELKVSSNRRNQILHDLMEGKSLSTSENIEPLEINEPLTSEPAAEMSEWEKRLEGKNK